MPPKAEDQVWLADWKRYKLPYCSLYVVSPDGNWPCKVGISVNPYKRLLSLQTSVWKRLKVTDCFWLEGVKEARELEKQVHRRLTGDNVWLHGEWFDMRPKDAREMIEFVSAVEGIEVNDKIHNEMVIEDLRRELSRSMDNNFYISSGEASKHKTKSGDDLANLANQYREWGMVVDPDLERMVKEHEEEEAHRRLPSLRSGKSK
jgi:hypothetical protein